MVKRIAEQPQRHERWFAAVQEEMAKGDYWHARLMKRWRLSKHSIWSRIHLLRQAGYDIQNIDVSARETCRRGHPRTPENTLLEKSGYLRCMACRRERR